MHDPCTLAFDIKYPWKRRPSQLWPKGYRESFISIWHNDPETDGTDDSCGWFKRSRHGNKEVLEKIVKEFNFAWQYLFDKDGMPVYSVISTVIKLYTVALVAYYNCNWNKSEKFMIKHLYGIILFAENPIDSLFPSITQQYGKSPKEDRIEELASIIYGWILRKEQKWYQHPRWHIHHWSFQIHPWQQFKRRWIDRCCICNERFGNEPAYGSWHGDKIWHGRCEPGRVDTKVYVGNLQQSEDKNEV